MKEHNLIPQMIWEEIGYLNLELIIAVYIIKDNYYVLLDGGIECMVTKSVYDKLLKVITNKNKNSLNTNFLGVK